MNSSNIPPFFYDSSEGDVTKESLMDFFLSWTLRCAQIESNKSPNLLYKYSKKILYALLFNDKNKLSEDIEISSVKTWKQWEKIDLCAEIEFNDKRKYALLIENKVYTKLHGDQIAKYKAIFEKHYKEKNKKLKEKYVTKYVYITCLNGVPEEDKKICKDSDFIAWTLSNLQQLIIPDIKDERYLTGNDLFDEFWIRMWDPDLRINE